MLVASLPSSSAAASLLPATPRLLACAVRFASKLPKGAARCSPFSCPPEQLSLLLMAVQQRVHVDSQTTNKSEACANSQQQAEDTDSAVAAADAEPTSTRQIFPAACASPAPALCHSDEQLVRSLMTQLHQWPDTMQQLWAAIHARRRTSEEVRHGRGTSAKDRTHDAALCCLCGPYAMSHRAIVISLV